MKIGVLGSGTWGTALARLLCNNGHTVTLYSVIKEEIELLDATREHPNLKGTVLPKEIVMTNDIKSAITGMDFVLFAVPSVYVRATAESAKRFISREQILIDVAKGIEEETMFTMSEIIRDVIPGSPVVVLSGPTHAEEVAKDLPTTIVAACEDSNCAKKVANLFFNSTIRAYINEDVRGVELSGALKNVIALAAGISSGLGYGDNAKAALITRGMAEIKRLGVALGCSEQTFSGLAGIGDLIVTATSEHSRNNRCGRLIGQGLSVEEAKAQVGMVVEGINALAAAVELSEKYGVRMNIVDGVNKIVNEGVVPRVIVDQLMSKPAVYEIT